MPDEELGAKDIEFRTTDQETSKEAEKKFPVWATIKIGGHSMPIDNEGYPDPFALNDSLIQHSARPNDSARGVMAMEQMRLINEMESNPSQERPAETDIDLVFVSREDLGLDRSASLKDAYDAAKRLGLFLCPTEAAWKLLLQYPIEKSYPKGNMVIGMEPVPDPDPRGKKKTIFTIEDRPGVGRSLDIYSGGLEEWKPLSVSDLILFVQSKNQ